MSALSYAGINETVVAVTGERERPVSGPLRIAKLDRRQFMKLTGLVGGGLMLSFTLPRAQASSSAMQPNGYVRIDSDGITLFAKNPEVGQGVKTSLPMIVAEELDAAWDDVNVVQSPIDSAVYGMQFAGGSMSIPMNWMPLRQAGATARAMLVGAAANELDAPASELSTQDSHVIHKASGRKLAYTALAAAAAEMPVPDAQTR